MRPIHRQMPKLQTANTIWVCLVFTAELFHQRPAKSKKRKFDQWRFCIISPCSCPPLLSHIPLPPGAQSLYEALINQSPHCWLHQDLLVVPCCMNHARSYDSPHARQTKMSRSSLSRCGKDTNESSSRSGKWVKHTKV